MGRHRWLPAAARGGAAPRLKRTPRFRIALGAAFVVAGLCLGYGIVTVATADLSRSAAPVLESVPLQPGSRTAAPSATGQEGAAAGASTPEPEPLGPGTAKGPAGADAESSGAEGSGVETGGPGTFNGGARIVVHVAGAVASPGIVRLVEGSRVYEAIDAAGGATKEAELEALNLAAPLADGQQVYVPTPQEAGPAGSGAGESGPVAGNPGGDSAGGGAPAKININTASAEELAELPRVGPVLAGRIVEFRQQHGPYGQPADLDAVPGIGPVMLETLVELVTV
jgi:competence protein ComEA